jgi:hypothetical protein
MSGSSIADVMTWIVIVALATTIVAHPASATIVKNGGQAFSNSLLAAQGKG